MCICHGMNFISCLKMFEVINWGGESWPCHRGQILNLGPRGYQQLPSGYVNIAIEHGDLVRGFSHEKW